MPVGWFDRYSIALGTLRSSRAGYTNKVCNYISHTGTKVLNSYCLCLRKLAHLLLPLPSRWVVFWCASTAAHVGEAFGVLYVYVFVAEVGDSV
jgi:hypothetical protein